jgi:putative transposase
MWVTESRKLMESDGRKHPVHLPSLDRFNTPIIIFLTVCTKDRKPILANDAAHQLLLDAWKIQPSWLVGRYVIMPDHVHLFCAPERFPPISIGPWVKFWKSHAARYWPHRQDAPIWQRHFWDTQLRRSENYDQKWEYVRQNPVRAGRVEESAIWPYQGELNVLEW